MDKPRLVVVIPTYNERGTIAKIIPLVLAQQERISSHEVSVLIVDGLSTDGTVEFVSDLSHNDSRVHLLLVPQRGLGLALRQAYDYAATDIQAGLIGQMDADLSHDPNLLPDLVAAIDSGSDLAIGSRYVEGGGTTNWPLSR